MSTILDDRLQTLRRRVNRDCRVIIQLDPAHKLEFIEKLEQHIWRAQLEEAGLDQDKLGRLALVLYGRLSSLRKKFTEKERRTGQRFLPLEFDELQSQ